MTTYTAKDFRAFAEIIAVEADAVRKEFATEGYVQARLAAMETLRNVARSMARRFADTSPRFDRERFMTACAVEAN
jgi:hypothetical protein